MVITVRNAVIWRNKNLDLIGTDYNGREIIGLAIIPIDCNAHIKKLLIERSQLPKPDDGGLLSDYFTHEADVYYVHHPDVPGEEPRLEKVDFPRELRY